ncbi:hypothetical protein YC2023_111486 [Brassica napus]
MTAIYNMAFINCLDSLYSAPSELPRNQSNQMDSVSSLDREIRSKEDEAEFQIPDSNIDKRKQFSGTSSQLSKLKELRTTKT